MPKKTKANRKTLKALADADFEPYPKEVADQFDAGPWGEECRQHQFSLLFAAAVLTKTKPELVQTVRKIEEPMALEWNDHIGDLLEDLNRLVGIASTAQFRMLSAMAAIADESPEQCPAP